MRFIKYILSFSLAFCLMTAPAYAFIASDTSQSTADGEMDTGGDWIPPEESDSLENTGIDISIGSDGITIKPGAFPDLSGSLGSVKEDVSKNVLNKAKSVAQLIAAICALICFTVFIVNISKLSLAVSNSTDRKQALANILWSGISLSFFGGIFMVVTFFWNLFLAV